MIDTLMDILDLANKTNSSETDYLMGKLVQSLRSELKAIDYLLLESSNTALTPYQTPGGLKLRKSLQLRAAQLEKEIKSIEMKRSSSNYGRL